MNLTVTEQAKEKLSEVPDEKMIQLSFDRGSCDIVNTLYEMKVIDARGTESYEKIIRTNQLDFIVDDDFEDSYDNELTIDYNNNFFVFKNKNQTFNNRIGLRYV
jgi:uncharacterized protein YqkB